jgi:hypothetical protein
MRFSAQKTDLGGYVGGMYARVCPAVSVTLRRLVRKQTYFGGYVGGMSGYVRGMYGHPATRLLASRHRASTQQQSLTTRQL